MYTSVQPSLTILKAFTSVIISLKTGKKRQKHYENLPMQYTEIFEL